VKLLGIDLEKERENQGLSTLSGNNRRKKIPPLLGAKPDDLSRVAEELRHARIQELRNSIHNTENSIKSVLHNLILLVS
jgi:hypothetical protein